MTERARIAGILRAFADQVEDSKGLDQYKELELSSIYVWGMLENGIQAPAIIRKTTIDPEGLSTPDIMELSDEQP